MFYRFRKPQVIIALTPLLLTLLLAVACGTAAPTESTTAPQPTLALLEEDVPTPAPELADAPPEVMVHPGKLTIMVGDMANERFDTIFVGGTPGWQNYSQLVHGVLINSTEKRELVPGIATQWGLSADGLTWTFTIRKGVKWHDGSELTADDVVWTLQHYLGPQSEEYSISSTGARMSRELDKIELSGPDELVLTTKQPEIAIEIYASDTTPGYFPVMPKRAELHDPKEEAAYDNNPIGAGIMSLVSRTPAQVMKFERFDDYYYQPANGFPEDKRVNFQSLDLFLVPEEATRVAALQAGEADIVPATLATKEQVEAGGGRMLFGAEGVVSQPGLQGCWEPQYPCHDKRVRQALDYAIDKELIRDQLYGGPEAFQVKGWMVVTPSTIGYTPELDPRPFDPVKARQLLADAGYPGGKGFGKLIVNVRAATTLPFMIESAQLAADMWQRELGLDVEVRVGDSTNLKERRYAGELNGQIYWEENDTRRDAINTVANSYGDPQSQSRWHEDPELFRLAGETVQILDPDRRAEALKKLFPRLREESYHLGIGYANTPWAVGPRVLTWEPYSLTLYPSALHTITLE
jgi:peptide/nickel transport system substrate-binding protein